MVASDSLNLKGTAEEFYQRFELLEVLGDGLTSVVRRCINRTTSQEYACKIIDVSDKYDMHEGLTLVEQVHREIEILRRLQGHPYIIELIESYETSNYIFLVFELCKQGELYEFLNSNVRMSEKRVRSYMKQLLLAVQHCHNNQVIHRDIKPENVLIQDDLEHIKLMDFGLSCISTPDQRFYELCGTPIYLAPEIYKTGIIRKTGYSFPVDAWACGIILFTLLIGRPPFYDRNRLRMIKQITGMHHQYTGLDWDTITEESQDLINRLLDKNPETRMTIDQALNHDVFKKPVLLRTLISRGGSQLEPCKSDMDDDNYKALLNPEISLPPPSVKNVASDASMVDVSAPSFNALRKLRAAAFLVRFIIRLKRLPVTPELIDMAKLRIDPYSIHAFRKKMDKAAFTLYHHWLKKSDYQNRAAMFQNKIKVDNVDARTDDRVCPI